MSKSKKIARDLPEPDLDGAPPTAEPGYDPSSHWCDMGDYCDQRRVEPPYTGLTCAQTINPGQWRFTAPEGMVLVEDEYQDARKIYPMTIEEPVPDPQADVVAEIKEWWIRTASDDSIAVAEKYREYGATSLCDLGYEMAEMMGWERPAKGLAQQLAVYYFLLGKMARLKTALLKGEPASDDTWLDITCYAMIARKVQASGAWPNGGE